MNKMAVQSSNLLTVVDCRIQYQCVTPAQHAVTVQFNRVGSTDRTARQSIYSWSGSDTNKPKLMKLYGAMRAAAAASHGAGIRRR